MCMYQITDISAEIWNKAGVAVNKKMNKNNDDETLLQLLCISDIAKRWGGKNI